MLCYGAAGTVRRVAVGFGMAGQAGLVVVSLGVVSFPESENANNRS